MTLETKLILEQYNVFLSKKKKLILEFPRTLLDTLVTIIPFLVNLSFP